MYNDKNFKSNIKSYKNLNKKDFNDNELPPETTFMAYPVILVDSVFKNGKNYYPQTYLKECKTKFTKEL